MLDKNYVPEVIDSIGHYAVASPGKIAQIDLASGRTETYSEMHERVARIAGYLQSLGIKRGDRVGFLALNSTDIVDIIMATWRIGGISLALNYRLTAHELDFIINDSEPDVIIIEDDFKDLIDPLKDKTDVRHWITFDGFGGPSEFETGIIAATPIYKMISQTLNDQSMLMYSSGTTGRPKGVIITHGMLFYSAVNGVSPNRTTSETVSLALMPLFHIGGLNITSLPALTFGGTAVVMRTFDPEVALDAIGDPELGITHMLGVPAMYNAMKLHPKNETTDFSRVIAAIAGGESVPKPLVEWWFDRGVVILDGYGMTESSASNCVSIHSDVPHKTGSSGKAMMFTQMRVVRQDGTDADAGEPGEIWMKGPTITPGYWRNEKANAESFTEGWFRSGDIARRDSDGFFTIEDRTKDMYISGGENVYPAEVESSLYGMEKVAEVAVIGVPDDKWGEVGCAFVVLKGTEDITVDEMSEHCARELAKYKHPKHRLLVDELPRNATGKVQKFKLRDMAPALLKAARNR